MNKRDVCAGWSPGDSVRRLWCWLFGHKIRTYFLPNPDGTTYPYMPLDVCIRCHEEDGWVKMVQSMAEFDQIVEENINTLHKNFKKAQKPDALA